MTYQELIDYYTNLLILQYHDKPKAKATIDLLISSLLPVNSATGNLMSFDIRDAYNLDTATGVQLDIIGKYVGLDRFFQGQTFEDTFFGFSEETKFEPPDVTGYADESDFLTKSGEFVANEDLVSQNNQLNDDDFRFLIKLKIVQNNINHSNKSIDDSLFQFFGTTLFMVDNENMTITYFLSSTLGALLTVIFEKELLPKPIGVKINNVILDNIYFSFTDESLMDSDSMEGYADESDFLTKSGRFFSNDDIIAM